MNNMLLLMGSGIIGLFLLTLFLNKIIKLSPSQAATISALISLAFLIPYSIINWPGGDIFALYFSCNLLTCYAYYNLSKGNFKHLKAKNSNKFHWAPISIFVFFLVLIIVDGTLVTMAQGDYRFTDESGKQVLSKFNGSVTLAYQKNEAAFNEHLAQIKIQKERAWKIKYGFANDPHANIMNTFIVEALDKDGGYIDKAEVTLDFIRPADKDLNQSFILKNKENGRYETDIKLPQPGFWQANIIIKKGLDIHKIIEASTEINP